MSGRVVYPGSFNPPTIAHLALAEAALALGFDSVELVVSHRALAKPTIVRPTFGERMGVLDESVASHARLSARATDAQLLADIAAGADALIVGMDKWTQIHEPRWYADVGARDSAIRSLPTVLLARRGDEPEPEPVADGPEVRVLDVPAELVDNVSSSAARAGRLDLMTPAARVFALAHGVWGAEPGS